MPKTVQIWGFGLTALHCARRLVERGHAVTGVARSTVLRERAEEVGARLRIGDLSHPETCELGGESADAIVVAAATKPTDVPRNPTGLYVEGHRRLIAHLENLSPRPGCVIVMSNTSVYGPASVLKSGLIDEASPLDPQPKRMRGSDSVMSNYTVESEKLWRASTLPWILLRVPAIIKPGRRALSEMMERGTYRPPAQDRTYQSIRVESLARVLEALVERGSLHEIYNATPPKVRSHTRAAKAAAREIGVDYDWPPEADLAAHVMIRATNLAKLGVALTAEDG